MGWRPEIFALRVHAAVRRFVLMEDHSGREEACVFGLIEQGHWSVKQCVVMMLGFKKFKSKVITIAGIELMYRIYKE